MRHFSGKRIAALVLAMLCLVCMSACMQTKPQTPIQTKPQMPRQLTVAVVGSGSNGTMLQKAAELYNVRNVSTEIKVTECESVSALTELLASEAAPDLFVLAGRLLHGDEYPAYCENLAAYLQADSGKECDVFPSLLDSLGTDEVYELPVQFRMETWASLEALPEERLSVAELEQYLHDGQNLFDISAWRKRDLTDWLLRYFAAAIPEAAQAEDILSDPDMTKLLDAVRALPESWEDQKEAGFLQRLYLSRSVSLSSLNEASQGSYTLCGIPTGFGSGSLFDITGEICMNKNSAHKNEAWGFMMQLLLPENQVLLADFPASYFSFDTLMEQKVKLGALTESDAAKLTQLVADTSVVDGQQTPGPGTWDVLSQIRQYLEGQASE